MRCRTMVLSMVAMLGPAISGADAQAQTVTSNVSGNYRCEPQVVSCRSGQTFSVIQSGNALQVKSDTGEQGGAHLTSDSTISAGPPWNMFGVVRDGAIEWSNGTKWHKQ
jgi:hypothetical protein